MEYINYYDSPLGRIMLASDGTSLTGLWLDGQKYHAMTLDPDHREKDLPVFRDTGKWLDQYFAGEIPETEVPLAPKGTSFRQEVWKLLLEIPYGETVTYGQLAVKTARKMGRRSMSAQAVGGAVGHNPISILIPCHRVLGSHGSLTGYAGGTDRKRSLLMLEGYIERIER